MRLDQLINFFFQGGKAVYVLLKRNDTELFFYFFLQRHKFPSLVTYFADHDK